MIPYPHQVVLADEAYDILKAYGLVYIAAEERTGKSLASILIGEMAKPVNILILTKKKALDGWEETLCGYFGKRVLRPTPGFAGLFTRVGDKKYTVTNYHQAGKINPVYDLVILDESHSYLSAFPKIGKIWKDVYRLTKGRPLIYLSATPYAQGYQLLFNQLRLSSWSPWKAFKSFYEWHRHWGIPDKTRTPYGLVETYSKIRPEVWNTVAHLFITKTRRELDFEHEPTDVIHHVTLDSSTRDLYNKCMSAEMIRFIHRNGTGPIKDIEGPLDSPMKLRTTLHMIEGGVAKVDDKYYILPNKEKIRAIKKDFGD